MRQAAPTGGGLLFPANFNPVHEGDWEACEVAEELLGGRVELNLEAHPPKEFTCRHPRPAVTVDAIILDRSGAGNLGPARAACGGAVRGQVALPSGFLEIDESAEDGVLRELAEETGIGGFRVEPFFTATGVDQDPRRRLISIVFLGEVRADELSQAAASDAADVRWFDVTDLPQTAFDHGEILGPALAVAVAD